MSNREPDPYQVLDIGPDATGADIARAYRRLAKAVHPDSRPGDPAATGQFRALSDAYGVLSDPARRAAWDYQHPPRRPQRPHAPGPAKSPLRPFPPAGLLWPAADTVGGAALRAGPVHIQPPAPCADGERARPSGDPGLAGLFYCLLAPGREWPW